MDNRHNQLFAKRSIIAARSSAVVRCRLVQMSAVANTEVEIAERAARGQGDQTQRKRTHDAIAQDETGVQNASKAMMLNAAMLPGYLYSMQDQMAQYVTHAGQTCAQGSTEEQLDMPTVPSRGPCRVGVLSIVWGGT